MAKRHLLTRRHALCLGLGGMAAMGIVARDQSEFLRQQPQTLENPHQDFTATGEATLKERAAAKGLIYGSEGLSQELATDAQWASRFVQECGILVPGWELKWYVGTQETPPLRPTPNQFNFTAADWMANFAKTHGLKFRGHTLVWYNSLPPWFATTVNSQNAESFMVQHIQTVVQRYAGQIHSWDVVNEAVDDTPSQHSQGLRETPWLKFLGPDYIDTAFRVAAEADPQALLVYNDYGLDYDTPEQDAKRAAVLQLLERLKAKGTPIHGLGIQAHLWGQERRFNPTKFRNFLHQVASLGLKILITEMDVIDQKLAGDMQTRDQIVAQVYGDYLAAALDEQAVIAVITWGLSDRYTWIADFFPRSDKIPVRPLPLDTNLQPKLAWNAIARAFDNAPKR